MVRITSREAEADAMGRVVRESVSLAGADVTPEAERAFIRETFEATRRTPDARAELVRLMEQTAEWLAARGWPDPRRGGVILDKDGWRYRSDVLPPSPVKMVRAVAYIVKEAGTLSSAGHAARIFEAAGAALAAYDAGDLGALFDRAHDLATAQASARYRHAFLQDVERGRKTRQGARKGGQATNQEADTAQRLARMAELVPKHGVSRAAHIAFDNGLGPSPSANRTLWYRRAR